MKGTVYLNEVLEQMKTPDEEGRAVPFSIKVRTFQRYSKTGGRLLSFDKAKQVMNEKKLDPTSVEALRLKSNPKTTFKKPPNHYQNKTRNIKVLPQGDIVKINIRFIIEFNGKKVIY